MKLRMKSKIKIILSSFICLSLFFGCSQKIPDDNNSDNNSEKETNEATRTQVEKNVFYPSQTTEKEEFYLQSTSSDIIYVPFEITFDNNYSKLTCTLYQLNNHAWNILEKFDLVLSGNTFWLLVSDNLTNASISYQNVNRDPSNMNISGGRPFQSVEPSFGMQGVMSHYDKTDAVSIKENKEFPVIANIFWKSKDVKKNLTANTDDFYHPENIDLEGNVAYYMLTFTFSK